MDFAVGDDHRVKLKESEKKNKYLNLAKELKNCGNMKVMFIPIVIGALGTLTKGLIKGLEDLEIREQVETIQTTTLLRSARILRRDLRRLVVTQTPVKDHQLTLMWKTNHYCYFKSNPTPRGYRKRMIEIWENSLNLRQHAKDLLTKLGW